MDMTQESQIHNQLSPQERSELWFHYYGNWIWRAVEALTTAKDFSPNMRSIADRLNISVDKAVDAIEGLVKLGILARANNTFVKVNDVTKISGDNLSVEKLLEGHSKLAPQVITKLDDKSIFTTRFCLGNEELIRKNASKIQDFLDSLDKDGEQLSNPDVLCVEVSIANLTRKSSGGLQ